MYNTVYDTMYFFILEKKDNANVQLNPMLKTIYTHVNNLKSERTKKIVFYYMSDIHWYEIR